MIEVSLIYATLLGVFFLVLSARVILLHGGEEAKLQAGGGQPEPNETLRRASRGHANFAEYVPLFLLLLLIAELNHYAPAQLHAAGIVFTIGRVAHGILFGFLGRSVLLRTGGMVLTFIGYAMVSVFNILIFCA